MAPQKRKRTPSIKQIEKKTGKTVRAVSYGADGSKTFSFVEPDNTEQTETDPWEIEAEALRKKKATPE